MSNVKRMNRIALAELRKVIIVWTTNLSKRQIVIIDAKSFKVIPATDAVRWAVERHGARMDHGYSGGGY